MATLDTILHEQSRRIDGSRIMVAVAHPDDETLSCGAQLSRWVGVRVLIATDGAPRNLADAHQHGFADAAGYAAQREREVRAALSEAGVLPRNTRLLRLPDQTAAQRMTDITAAVRHEIEHGIEIIITHAFEGGHPDHDAMALSVHLATRDRVKMPLIVEMPFYHADGSGGWRRQRFVGNATREHDIELDAAQIELKRAMAACHASQQATLQGFDLTRERVRPQPAYDWTRLPSDGPLLYAHTDWGLSPTEWLNLSRDVLGERHESAA